jgi:hypothetical protein
MWQAKRIISTKKVQMEDRPLSESFPRLTIGRATWKANRSSVTKKEATLQRHEMEGRGSSSKSETINREEPEK